MSLRPARPSPADPPRGSILRPTGGSRGLMCGRAGLRRLHVVADREGARKSLDPVAAAETSNKGMGKGGILEIEREDVVDDARRSRGCGCPTFGAASLVEPGMHDIELAAKPFRRNRNPQAHRIPPLRLALSPHRRSCHTRSLFMLRSIIILTEAGLSRGTAHTLPHRRATAIVAPAEAETGRECGSCATRCCAGSASGCGRRATTRSSPTKSCRTGFSPGAPPKKTASC